jgi:hypothetical protein
MQLLYIIVSAMALWPLWRYIGLYRAIYQIPGLLMVELVLGLGTGTRGFPVVTYVTRVC